MSTCKIVDTFPAFLTYWDKAQHLSLDQQIAAWEQEYLASWPELLAKQADNYQADGLDWRLVAREKVFPYLPASMVAMREAHRNLLASCQPIFIKAQQALDFESDVQFVIYVGIGCGAGWVTPFNGSPAILFGLENIAECGWSSREAIEGLIAHEIGHLVHRHWRAQSGKAAGSGPWWQLYEEGFAQRCESLIIGRDSWHQAQFGKNDDWFSWCRSRQGWLASEFLKSVDGGKPVTAFFGSWFNIEGRIETGYFLGYEVIRALQKNKDLKEIALLENPELHLRPVLEEMK